MKKISISQIFLYKFLFIRSLKENFFTLAQKALEN